MLVCRFSGAPLKHARQTPNSTSLKTSGIGNGALRCGFIVVRATVLNWAPLGPQRSSSFTGPKCRFAGVCTNINIIWAYWAFNLNHPTHCSTPHRDQTTWPSSAVINVAIHVSIYIRLLALVMRCTHPHTFTNRPQNYSRFVASHCGGLYGESLKCTKWSVLHEVYMVH